MCTNLKCVLVIDHTGPCREKPETDIYTPAEWVNMFLRQDRQTQETIAALSLQLAQAVEECVTQNHQGMRRFFFEHQCPLDEYNKGFQAALSQLESEIKHYFPND
jgi:hypothetical protein